MKHIIFFIYSLIAVALQNTWFSGSVIYGLRFDFVLPIVLFASVRWGWQKGVPLIIFNGILLDISSSGPFGINALCLLTIYFLIRFVVYFISIDTIAGRFFWLVVVSLIYRMLISFILLIRSSNSAWIDFWFRNALPQSIFDGLVGLIVIATLDKMSNFTDRSEERAW